MIMPVTVPASKAAPQSLRVVNLSSHVRWSGVASAVAAARRLARPGTDGGNQDTVTAMPLSVACMGSALSSAGARGAGGPTIACSGVAGEGGRVTMSNVTSQRGAVPTVSASVLTSLGRTCRDTVGRSHVSKKNTTAWAHGVGHIALTNGNIVRNIFPLTILPPIPLAVSMIASAQPSASPPSAIAIIPILRTS